MKSKHNLLLLLTLFLVSLSLVSRGAEVLNGNYIFLLDQGRDYIGVKNIVVGNKLTLVGAELGYGLSGFQGIFHGPFYFYFLSIPFILFNGDPYGGLLLMFLFGMLTIIISFIFAKKLLGLYGGFIMALLVASSPPVIAHSRFVFNPHPADFFILITLLFTYLAKRGRKLYIFLASFFSGFIYNFEMAVAIPMSIATVLYIIFIVRPKKFPQYFALFGGFILAYSPFILFELRHGFQGIRSIVGYFGKSQFQPQLYLEKLTNDQFAMFVHNFFIAFPQQTIVPQFLILLLLVSGVVFFILHEKEKQKKLYILYLCSIVVITFGVLAFIRTHTYEHYLNHLTFVYLFLFTYVLTASSAKREFRFQLLLVMLLVVFLLAASISAAQALRSDIFDYGGMSKIKGKLDAIDYIYNNAKGEKFGLLVFAPPVYTYPYDYLMWWHGQRKYGYIPYQEKKGTFYLLIEQDLSAPWTYKGWLETVIKDGELLETKELPSGFIIQKRLAKEHAT